jgi:uncharacterized membrane protein YebE (DUF533 family)
MEETIERLKGWLKAGALLAGVLLVAYVAFKLAIGLLSMLIPVLFVGGAAYLGYRWWQRKIAPPEDQDYYDIELERERRRRW